MEGRIVEVRKDVFAPDVVVSEPQTGTPVRVPGRLIEAGTDYIVLRFGDDGEVYAHIEADLKDVQIPRDQQVVGLAVKFDVVGDYKRQRERGERLRAINVVAA